MKKKATYMITLEYVNDKTEECRQQYYLLSLKSNSLTKKQGR